MPGTPLPISTGSPDNVKANTRLAAGARESEEVASLPRLELGTYCLEGSCSVQLSYRDKPAI